MPDSGRKKARGHYSGTAQEPAPRAARLVLASVESGEDALGRDMVVSCPGRSTEIALADVQCAMYCQADHDRLDGVGVRAQAQAQAVDAQIGLRICRAAPAATVSESCRPRLPDVDEGIMSQVLDVPKGGRGRGQALGPEEGAIRRYWGWAAPCKPHERYMGPGTNEYYAAKGTHRVLQPRPCSPPAAVWCRHWLHGRLSGRGWRKGREYSRGQRGRRRLRRLRRAHTCFGRVASCSQ